MAEQGNEPLRITEVNRNLLANQFTYHAPKNDQLARYAAIRAKALDLAQTIVACCPPSADTSAAIRKVREAAMTANAAIAIGEAGVPEGAKIERGKMLGLIAADATGCSNQAAQQQNKAE